MFVKIKEKSGLTLIELITVIAILAILLGIAIPAINDMWLPGYRLKSATRDMASNMHLAKMRAITLNQNYGISFDLGGGTYTLFRDENANNQLDADDTVERLGHEVERRDDADIELPSDVTFTECTFANDTAIFRPGGTSNGGRVDVQNSKGTRSVTVLFTTGRIKIQ